MSLVSVRNTLFLKQDNQIKDEHIYGGGDICRVLGVLLCTENSY